MDYNDYFWNASTEELKQGFFYDDEQRVYTCIICGKSFEKGIVYPIGACLYSAKRAVSVHISEAHGSVFDFLLDMGKVYTSLTEHQKALMKLFYSGLSDKEIVQQTSASSTSTIRNQRFVLKERYKQAKVIVAMMELLEERKGDKRMNNRSIETEKSNESLVDIHRTATMIDERYAITQAEKDEVLGRYFNQDNKLLIKDFPVKEKKKIIILQHLSKEFEPNREYTEKEVNEIVGRFYADIPTTRRYLIQYGFLDRKPNGEAYWVKQ